MSVEQNKQPEATKSNYLHPQGQDPIIDNKHREPEHSNLPPLSSLQAVVEGWPSPWRLTLDGNWVFAYFPSAQKLPHHFYSPDFNSSDWQSIPVPSHWECEGQGLPQSPQTQDSPAKDSPSDSPPENQPSGCYRKTFTLPEEWKERHENILIRFEGICSAAEIWLNGSHIGDTQDSCSPAEFRLSPFLQEGKNLLALRVFKWNKGANLKKKERRPMGGIFRSVTLEALPEGGVHDLYARCRFDNKYRHADLDVRITLNPLSHEGKENRHLNWYLIKPDSADIFASSPSISIPLQGKEKQNLTQSLLVHDPEQWTAENPQLYHLVIEVKNDAQEIIDVRGILFGFRQIEIIPGKKGALLNVNGKSVKLLGVRYHGFHPRYGQALPQAVLKNDLLMLKRHNINALRCHHQPDFLYTLADRLGLYVIDEATEDKTGFKEEPPQKSEPRGQLYLDRVERMLRKNRNHPCIIFWALGKGGDCHKILKAMKITALKQDPSRPIYAEGEAAQGLSDISSPGKSLFKKTRKELADYSLIQQNLRKPITRKRQGIASDPYRENPFLFAEFSQALGNSLGNIAGYVAIMRRYSFCVGGFLGDFADQALYTQDSEGKEYLDDRTDFGEKTAETPSSAKGIVSATRQAQPELAEVKAVYAPISVQAADLSQGKITISNHHSHTDLSNLGLAWKIEREGKTIVGGLFKDFSIPPQQQQTVKIFRALNAYPSLGEGFLTLTFRLREKNIWAESGHEIAQLQLALPQTAPDKAIKDGIFDQLNIKQESPMPHQESPDKASPWIWKKNKDQLLIAGPKIGVRIKLPEAALESLDWGKGNILTQALEPDFLRSPTDGDRCDTILTSESSFLPPLFRGLQEKIFAHDWDQALKKRRLAFWRFKEIPTGLSLCLYLKVSGFLGFLKQRILLRNNGEVQISLSGIPLQSMPRFGLSLALPDRYRQVHWYGQGPQENYPDRQSGALVSEYHGDAAALSHDYLNPQESGNRGGIRRVSFSDGNTAIVFRAEKEQPLHFSARFATREALNAAAHTHEIKKSAHIHINIDGFQKGLGSSLPDQRILLPAYRIKAGRRYHYQCTLARKIG